MGVKRGFKYNKETTPYVTKFTEGGKVYPFPSLKQMNCFKKDVENIVEIYENGGVLYKKHDNGEYECMNTIESAVDNAYNKRYEKWLSQEMI